MSSFEPEFFNREQQRVDDELSRLTHINEIYAEQGQTLVLRWNDNAGRNVNLQILTPMMEEYSNFLDKSAEYSAISQEFATQLQKLSGEIDQAYQLFEREDQQKQQTEDFTHQAKWSQKSSQASSAACALELQQFSQQITATNNHVNKLA